VHEHNTPQCESLPSQISNFTLQFFGTVVKTEVNGAVVWSLPCGLDVGLPANPRGVDEGLACYFLRLFSAGIVGLKGDQGDPGLPGTPGNNAYTVTLGHFNQPTLGAPNIQVATQYNPALLDSLYLFIPDSGWYQQNSNDGNGTLFLTLVKTVTTPLPVIPAGHLVVPSGFPGASIKGDKGDQGVPGIQGPAGGTVTGSNGQYFAPVGTNFPLPLGYTPVTFVNSSPQFLAPAAGTYLVIVGAQVFGEAGCLLTDFASLKLVNTSTMSDIPGSEKVMSGLSPSEVMELVVCAIVTTGSASNTIALYGQCTVDSHMGVSFTRTTLTWVRLS
jgi:hypothetical protein